MKMRTARAILLSAGLYFGAMGAAHAGQGVFIPPDVLAAPDRAALVAEIQRARAADPGAFKAIGELRAKLPELDANKRGLYAHVTPALKALGPAALLPMLEELAVNADGRGALTESAWYAWRMGLLEAVGALRDARSTAVLAAIVEGPPLDLGLMRAAVAAYGKLGTDAVAAKLVAMASTPGPKQKGVLWGMGECRRTVVAEALARAMAAKPAPEVAEMLFRSLGDVGSAWAWRTPIIARSGEEAATRAIAAKALVSAFTMYEGDARRLAGDAVIMVDDPSTPALIAAAKRGASPGLAADLDALAARFAKSPIR